MKNLINITLILFALSLTSNVNAKTCELEVNSNDMMKFDQTEMKISADCSEVKLTLNHTGKLAKNVMGHNWVLTATADMQTVATAGMTAGLEQQYLPADRSKVLATTDVIGGGESTSITFSTAALTQGGDYTFFCSFPGHWSIMKGKFIVE
jgi:azurin